MKQGCIFLIVCIFIFNSTCSGFSSEDSSILRVPLICEKKDTVDIKIEFESILREMPPYISIMEGVERIRHSDRFSEILKYLKKFKNLNTFFYFESNMLPLFVETRKTAEDLDRSAARILSDKELMPIFEAIPSHHPTKHLLACAILTSDDAHRTIKTFINKGGDKKIFSRVEGEFIAAYLAARKTRQAAMALLNVVNPDDFAWGGKMKNLSPNFGIYYAERDDTYYVLLELIWFYLTPVYEKLRGRGYTFEETGEALAYLCEHLMDKGFGVPLRRYGYELWLRENEKAIKERTTLGGSHTSGMEQFKTMMDIIKTCPKGIPPAALFVDKANTESLNMRDICRSMRDTIESLGKKFVGPGQFNIHDRPYLAKFPLYQFYERLLHYAWFSQPWECETQDDASVFSFRLHYYTPLLSEWANNNSEDSLISALTEVDVNVTEDEKVRLRDVLQNVRKKIKKLKAVAAEIPPPVYEEEVNVNHIINDILKEYNTQLQLDLPPSFSLVKGNKVLLKKVLTAILENRYAMHSLWEGVSIKTLVSSDKFYVIVDSVPTHEKVEVLKIMLNPRRLYLFEDRLDILPEGSDFSETAAIIEAHGGKIYVESEKEKTAKFTIQLPISLSSNFQLSTKDSSKAKGVSAGKQIKHTRGRLTGL